MTVRVAVLHPTDLNGHAASGIDSFVRGIVNHAPDDLSITLFGAADISFGRAVNQEMAASVRTNMPRWMPLVQFDSGDSRKTVPLTARYALGLLRAITRGKLREFDVLDFHRMEPALLFWRDRRPKRLVMHQDLSGVLDSHSEIRWQHAPQMYRKLENIVLPTMNQLKLVREDSRDAYTKRFPKLAGRFELTPTFFDSETFSYINDIPKRMQLGADARASLGLTERARVLLFVGRLDKAKNPRLLIEALGAPSLCGVDIHLILIGDGTLRAELSQLVGHGSLQGRITMLGSQSKSNIRRVMHAADIFVLSSAYEGMPIAVLEALACGVPVVSTDVGQLHNLIKDSVNGMLCRSTSAVDFAACIRAALDRADEMRGKNCADSVRRFTADLVLEDTYGSYRELAEHGRLDRSLH
jgi:glycosyltransferase involved in cell wall biosynthesis